MSWLAMNEKAITYRRGVSVGASVLGKSEDGQQPYITCLGRAHALGDSVTLNQTCSCE